MEKMGCVGGFGDQRGAGNVILTERHCPQVIKLVRLAKTSEKKSILRASGLRSAPGPIF